MGAFIFWVKQLYVVKMIWWVIRNLWPFFVFLLFWPEISGFMSQFGWWDDAVFAVRDFWWDLQYSPVYVEITGWFRDIWGWMIDFAEPSLEIIKNAAITVIGWIKGIFA